MKRYYSLLILAVVYISAHASEPPAYYDSALGKSGNSLRNALMDIIDGHTDKGYSGLWTIYKTSDVRDNGTIWDMYSTCTFQKGTDQCGGSGYKNICDCYNREHTVPQSWFSKKAPMVSDAYHIYPTDGKVNGERDNFPYGECANGQTWTNALGKKGQSTFNGYNGTVFEPVDDYKGDFARSYFYMITRYANQNFTSSGGSVCFTYTAAANPKANLTPYAQALFLKWHRQDPVSQKELDRQEAVYAAQNNRNPFIDHPELAEFLWGDSIGRVWNGQPITTNLATTTTEEFLIYPNPANDYIRIDLGSSARFSYEIYNLQAMATLKGEASSGEGINISELNEGLYFIRIILGNQSLTKKIVIFR